MANPPYCPLHALRGDRWGSWGFPRVDGYEPVPTTLDFCVMPVQSGRKQVLLRQYDCNEAPASLHSVAPVLSERVVGRQLVPRAAAIWVDARPAS